MSAARSAVALLFLSFLFASCAPKLGEGCDNNIDCSVTASRDCDLAQPGGYCTIANCTPRSCGDEGRCVRFRPDEPRLAADWCMASCEDTGDCGRDAYVCRSAAQLNEARRKEGEDNRIAEVLGGNPGGKFCVAKD
jgi:hypothetical protein